MMVVAMVEDGKRGWIEAWSERLWKKWVERWRKRWMDGC